MSRAVVILLGILSLGAGSGHATIIGHADVDQVAGLPQSVFAAINQQRWLFAHASVGANMIDGMTALHGDDPLRYGLVFAVAGDGSQIFPPPSPTTPGTVYDGSRGNPGWAAKFAMFNTAVRSQGWRYPVVDAAMNKLCFIDDTADAGTYLATMTALENDQPATTFIYTTMPLQSGSDMNAANIHAMNYNQAVRLHCVGNNRILFDVADIESHDPAGNAVTFTDQGHTYQRLYSGYTTDGGHLNALGSRRVALGWYAAAAVLASPVVAVPPAAGQPAAQITSIVPNPFNPLTTVHFQLASASQARLAVFDARGRLVGTLFAGDLTAGAHTATWRGCDDAGRAVATGIYLVRLTTPGATSIQRITLAR
jgi:hypothetical protein